MRTSQRMIQIGYMLCCVLAIICLLPHYCTIDYSKVSLFGMYLDPQTYNTTYTGLQLKRFWPIIPLAVLGIFFMLFKYRRGIITAIGLVLTGELFLMIFTTYFLEDSLKTTTKLISLAVGMPADVEKAMNQVRIIPGPGPYMGVVVGTLMAVFTLLCFAKVPNPD